MITHLFRFATFLLAAVSIGAWASPQSASFTYQGQLQSNGQPANGTFPALFTLFDAQSGGNQVGATTSTSVTATNGAFSTVLNYPGAFNGTQLWLEITVNGEMLSGRQPISTAPVAQFALNGGASLYYNVSASTAASPPVTVLATVGTVTYKASCGLAADNSVSASLTVASPSTFDLSEIIFAQFNGTGALTSGPAQGTGLTSATVESAVAASGNYLRVWVSPSILHSFAIPAMTQAIQVYIVADARTNKRTCTVEGHVSAGF